MAEPRTVRENANTLNSEQIAALLPLSLIHISLAAA